MMGSNQPADFYEYMDTELSILVPSYLRQRKGMPFFQARSNKHRQDPVLHFAVGVLDEDGVKLHRDIMMRMNPGTTDEWMGLQGTVMRRGNASYLGDGLELLTSSYNTVTGEVHHGYNVLLLLGSRGVYATFLGQGELSEFEGSCRQVVLSVRIVEGGGERRAPMRAAAANGLGRADRARLTRALDGLPPAIAYLRSAITAIAKQDQDLLGSGEADISSIERSLRKVAKADAIRPTARAHAEVLHQWLAALPDSEGVWAAPLWFVEGCLRGSALFGADAS